MAYFITTIIHLPPSYICSSRIILFDVILFVTGCVLIIEAAERITAAPKLDNDGNRMEDGRKMAGRWQEDGRQGRGNRSVSNLGALLGHFVAIFSKLSSKSGSGPALVERLPERLPERLVWRKARTGLIFYLDIWSNWDQV